MIALTRPVSVLWTVCMARDTAHRTVCPAAGHGVPLVSPTVVCVGVAGHGSSGVPTTIVLKGSEDGGSSGEREFDGSGAGFSLLYSLPNHA